MKKWIFITAVFLYLLAGALLPFITPPEITEKTKNNMDLEEFYGNVPSGEYARIISQNGEALEERIRLISQAEEKIILSTFEFDADISGKKMLSALMDAAQRGVKISVLADGVPYITAMWGNPYFLALAGMEPVEIKVYNPVRIWKPWTFMGRMHDKYLIVDDKAYILGGRNTYDYFLGDQPGHKNYDWDVLVYCPDTGTSSLTRIKDYFQSVWELPVCRTLGKSSLWKSSPAVRKAEEDLKEEYLTLQKEHDSWLHEKDYGSDLLPVDQIRLITNPTHIYSKEPVVYYTITELMKQAENEVIFHTPYIICDTWMTQRLKDVCGRNKAVHMMTNSAANNGNPFGAMDYLQHKDEILETGVQILEYDGGVSYHGKCFTIDDRLSGIGSFNWDMRSTYLDTEVMLIIDGKDFNRQLRSEMKEYEKEALKVINEHAYDLPAETVPRQLTPRNKFLLDVLKNTIGWARFLM